MSEPLQPGAPEDAPQSSVSESEEVDGLPVLAGAGGLHAQGSAGALAGAQRAASTTIPAVHAAAMAAGGFVAGAAVVGLVHRRQRRVAAVRAKRWLGRGASARRDRRGVSAGELVQIVGSRSVLLDVHLLGGSGGQR